MATRKSSNPKILLSDAIEEKKPMATDSRKKYIKPEVKEDKSAKGLQRGRNILGIDEAEKRKGPLTTNTPSAPGKEGVPTSVAKNEAKKVAEEAVANRGSVDTAIRTGFSKTVSAVKKNPIAAAVVGTAGLVTGAVALNRRKKRKQQQDSMYGYNNQYQGGDVWANPDGACASLEAKCFNDPKRFGSSPAPGKDDILQVPGLVGRLAATVRS